jgi:ribose transport system substrate-binding protein
MGYISRTAHHGRRLGAAIAIALVAAACANQTAPGKLTIAVIPKGTSHVFWQSIHAGAVKAGSELGVEIAYRGPLREDDRDSQVAEVENAVGRGVSGIVLAPLDDAALVGPVSAAMRQKVPVVIIDSGLKGDDYVSFVATDNEAGGRLGGEKLAQFLGGKGRVILLRYAEGSDSTTKREEGFLSAMKANPGIQIVSSNQYAGADVEGAYKKGEAILSQHKRPDGSLDIDGIFCANESSTFGMLRVLQDNGWAGKVRFVGFDASDSLVQALKNGHIHGLVVQDPVKMGYLGVKTLVAHLKSEKIERRIDTGVRVVTQADMDSPEAKELLKPDLDRWLKKP